MTAGRVSGLLVVDTMIGERVATPWRTPPFLLQLLLKHSLLQLSLLQLYATAIFVAQVPPVSIAAAGHRRVSVLAAVMKPDVGATP